MFVHYNGGFCCFGLQSIHFTIFFFVTKSPRSETLKKIRSAKVRSMSATSSAIPVIMKILMVNFIIECNYKVQTRINLFILSIKRKSIKHKSREWH